MCVRACLRVCALFVCACLCVRSNLGDSVVMMSQGSATEEMPSLLTSSDNSPASKCFHGNHNLSGTSLAKTPLFLTFVPLFYCTSPTCACVYVYPSFFLASNIGNLSSIPFFSFFLAESQTSPFPFLSPLCLPFAHSHLPPPHVQVLQS
jgi:hypothetical protein